MKLKLAKDMLVVRNDRNTLVYNPFTNSMCIIKNELYNRLTENEYITDDLCASADIDKLVQKGILIRDFKEYLDKDFARKYLGKCEQRKVCIETVYFHITQRCNLNCIYCYNKANRDRVGELPLNKIDQMINIIADMNVRRIVLTGGEALLYENIYKVCTILQEKNFFVELLTNGVLLGEKKKILELVDHVIVSLDTIEKQDAQRRGLNTEMLLETLRAIEKSHRHKIMIRSVISRYNEESVQQVKKFCEDNSYEFLPSVYIPNSLEEVANMPARMICAANEEHGDICSIGAKYCGGGYHELALDVNGDIYPCQMLVKNEFKMGNIFELPHGKIEISAVNEQFMKRKITEVEECKDCQYKYLCGGGCPAVSYMLFGQLNTAPKPVCNYLKYDIDKKLERVLNEYGF